MLQSKGRHANMHVFKCYLLRNSRLSYQQTFYEKQVALIRLLVSSSLTLVLAGPRDLLAMAAITFLSTVSEASWTILYKGSCKIQDLVLYCQIHNMNRQTKAAFHDCL